MERSEELEIVKKLLKRLYPINRSITGKGLRESLDIFGEYIELEREHMPSGTKVNNWTIPDEWEIKEAWIKDSDGNKVVDFKDSNLHIVNYSTGINKKMTLEELKPYIYTIPKEPDAIPYITSYYKRRWGFCMSHNEFLKLKDGVYHVYIDAKHFKGQLDYAHAFLTGKSKKEVLLSSYLCHPSMVNNELSGPIVLLLLYNRLKKRKNRFSYRFLLAPETIGSITYLSKYGNELKKNVYSGAVLTCLGEDKPLSAKRSRQEFAPIDNVFLNLINVPIFPVKGRIFDPRFGSDERQFCSPGYNLPVIQLSKGLDGGFKEYHNSLDNLDFIKPEDLIRSANEIEQLLINMEYDGYYINQKPYGEVKLDEYNLYSDINNSNKDISKLEEERDLNILKDNVLLLLNYCDGIHRLSDIANKYCLNIIWLIKAIDILKENGLLKGPFSEEHRQDF